MKKSIKALGRKLAGAIRKSTLKAEAEAEALAPGVVLPAPGYSAAGVAAPAAPDTAMNEGGGKSGPPEDAGAIPATPSPAPISPALRNLTAAARLPHLREHAGNFRNILGAWPPRR